MSQLDIGLSFSNPVSLLVDEEFRDAVLEQDYETIYTLGLSKSIYNVVLGDYSFFQFSSAGEDGVRYAFYPNPFRHSDEFTNLMAEVEGGIISLEELANLLSERATCTGVPPVRYEYAPGQYREIEHPSAHFHIGHHVENRWPVARRLTPFAFTMWIVRMYYSPRWDLLAEDGLEFGNPLNAAMAEERRRCGELAHAHFSERERRLFHFT
jgi:hypothetical protein